MGNDLISIDTGDFVLFQSSFPRGERPSSSTRIPFLSQFQSTFPRGERRSKRSDSDYFTDFNPRSRVGNDSINRSYRLRYIISIHVPAWGTTHVQRLRPVNYAVFQSTFPRGERRRETKKAMFGWAFQSTFPRGERRSLSCIFIHDELFQSTFPRGERQNVCRLFLIFCHFNPRSRVGNDAIALIPPIIPPISIHVPAWGTTPAMLISWQGEPYFNPRSRVGNDPAPFTIAATPDISIHVPAWGTTSLTFPQGRQYSYFNPRSRVGNDQGRNMRLLLMFDFNPRSRVGNDGRARPLSDGWCISIHVPAWGTTPSGSYNRPLPEFQSTFPRGERHASLIVALS